MANDQNETANRNGISQRQPHVLNTLRDSPPGKRQPSFLPARERAALKARSTTLYEFC